ncbi:nuclear protein SNF4 [Sporothrix brasiliensis 5110]|uniref:Nuclear protein SNF4 n=1 Tax=Sporothrix brasiliensis 5110 TaxID=1398154 RepID=A0A0C2FTK5_9PEZI|nr:nuclear protein SNF4 [Sporothrix brasiliensis 5110]KIH94373.1 nuclear protein SNF4 [Sporothrix brasiliensis 5110]
MADAQASATAASPAEHSQPAEVQPQQQTSAAAPGAGVATHELPFVTPSSYLRPNPDTSARAMADARTYSAIDREQMQGLENIRAFLKIRTSYDVLPLSFRLIVLDTDLLIRKSLTILIQNNIVSAPLWDSHNSTFAGLLTSTDFINVIQYYCQYPDRLHDIDQFRLSGLRDIEKAIGAQPLETISVHPMKPLYEACTEMLKTRARRIPLVDVDDETGREMVVSVITQYRILKFIAVNNENNTVMLKKPVREIGLGTYSNLQTAHMSDSVLDVIHVMVEHNISAVPIVDADNRVLNVFEAVDVIPCIKGGVYDDLQSSVGEALSKRAEDFPGIYTCSEDDRLDSIFDTVRKSRVHRLIVIDDESRLRGMISLSDILKYVLLFGEENDTVTPDAV